MVGTADSVLIREVSLIQSVLYREVLLWCTHCYLVGTTGVDKEELGRLAFVDRMSSLLQGTLHNKI